ncbi:hypothetical protein PVK06_032949 [Gossypium arboreum]|uniref:Uncharacterized protein n=1 Tax=Gossypium arboreum TaxID=29729 RepID=A0ABR0NY12_GOSAR|nr:hypothetical protein PVK06_032949 [Gossypium arboreum]
MATTVFKSTTRKASLANSLGDFSSSSHSRTRSLSRCQWMESAEKTLYHILKEAGGKVKIRADLVKALKNKRFEPNVVTNVLGERLDRKLAPGGGERFIRLNKSKKAIKI